MSFKFSAAHSSRIKKSNKPPGSSKVISQTPEDEDEDEDEDLFNDRLGDIGLVKALATDLNLRDVAQTIMYIQGTMWSGMPEQRGGMNSTRIAEVLNFRSSLPPIVTVSHVHSHLQRSPTTVEREIAELIKGGSIRKTVVGGRGSLGEALILVNELDKMIQNSNLEVALKESFTELLHRNPTALAIPRSWLTTDDAKSLMHVGFITSSTPSWTSTNVFSRPGDGSRGTVTSLESISKAASGSIAAVGGEGAVHAAGGSGGGARSVGVGDFSLAIPNTGPFLKLTAHARSHLLSLLSKSKFREAPESLLRQRWDGGIAVDDSASAARRNRGEFAGVLPGRTRKWKQFYGISFEWILGECVGAGLVEVFDTGSIGRGVRALRRKAMNIAACSARYTLSLQICRVRRCRPPAWTGLKLGASKRFFHASSPRRALQDRAVETEREAENTCAVNPSQTAYWEEYKGSYDVPAATFGFQSRIFRHHLNTSITAHGFLSNIVSLGQGLVFAQLKGGSDDNSIQITSRKGDSEEANAALELLRKIPSNSAVSITGLLQFKPLPKNPAVQPPENADVKTENPDQPLPIRTLEILLQSVTILNSFAPEVAGDTTQNYSPENRHLQIRFDPELKRRLRFRSDVAAMVRSILKDFQEIETPILFKSTSEGAREFLVPVRRRGYAYALPQSPQQYKQILMASGINKYLQFAKCFRDEGGRADRQPEFTQVDLEIAFSDGNGVMNIVENMIKTLWRDMSDPIFIKSPLPSQDFLRITYEEAMSRHGSDKPDLRIPNFVDHILPRDLKTKVSSLEDPILEACRFRFTKPKAVNHFISRFMDSPDAEVFRNNPDGAPGIFLFDTQKPLEGLHALGFEAADKLKSFYSGLTFHDDSIDSRGQDVRTELENGDLLLVQARPNIPHSRGYTMLGKLRLAIFKAALAEGLLESDPSHHFLWVTDFPMFTLDNSSDPGQGGEAGFSATHHPFTAPKSAADVDLLLTDPLKAKADHYDLVVNGVELGGGSRRIHNAAMQRFIMRDILKVDQRRSADFDHLYKALGAGCPPHAGFAIGFDRLLAVMLGRESVRDVIAFPKSSKGEDMMVKSPSVMSKDYLEQYHIKLRPTENGTTNGYEETSSSINL
ncbi:hypothetical protein B7494_g1986 [Chlorociboria aeruginascens]|nr:hypothetical protein B7494_g1986 [Chlorociboria aeruginascens]